MELELAEIGLKIVLISRSTTKLEKVAAEIEKTYKVQTKIITADFTEINGIYDDIEAKLEGLEIGILVNNVGMAYAIPGKLLDIPNLKKFIPDIVYCNCASMTMMTQICLPNMIKRKRGVILNISSASAIDPCPYISVYSSTKAYMDLFSRAIDYEYHKNGIIVQSVMPFFVKTNMTNLRKQSFFIPEAWTYVRSALKTIGVESRTHGYFSHSIQAYFARRLPKSYVTNLKISSLSAARERMLKRMKIKEENPK
ncbi:very-long-chain 3-oxoacyl-CoA reductase-like isoform X2 [Antedon mediterranea]|uniref:very-long-chain 3-oxoacyl-CoA reductase-like isoform X2 n=1 Tax=Antedon mediterranea TaxID=105859 RepID=UPI003AF667C8